MMKLIDGRAIAERIKDDIAKNIHQLSGSRPNLAIILAGDREDSALYVSLKEREAKKVGIDTHTYRLGHLDTEADLLNLIKFLNNDELIDGILVQLPLPDRFDTAKILAALDPQKDVDGFCPNHSHCVLSPVLAALEASLLYTQADYRGQKALILHNSEVFGDSVLDFLASKEITAQKLSFANYDQLGQIESEKLYQQACALGKEADIVVTALGLPKLVKADMIRSGAVIIDIGICRDQGKVCGDVDLESVKDVAGWLTPVPGGIGPMTIAFLFQNVLALYRQKEKKKNV